MYKTSDFITIKATAKENLLGNYRFVIPALLMINIFSLLINNLSLSMNSETGFTISFLLYLIFSAISILLLKVFSIGKAHLFLNLMTNREVKLNNIYQGFKHNPKYSLQLCFLYLLFVNILGYVSYLIFERFIFTNLLQSDKNINTIFIFLVLFLVCFLLFLYIALSFSQVFYLANDFANLSAIDTLKFSWKLMEGNRIYLLKLHLSFIPWYLLSVLTCGIALFWVLPYLYATLTLFYLDVIDKQ